jgi:hypothetical protein
MKEFVSKKNGGFPPLKYKNENVTTNSKERSYAAPINHDINIRQLLTVSNKPFLINTSETDNIEIIENL